MGIAILTTRYLFHTPRDCEGASDSGLHRKTPHTRNSKLHEGISNKAIEVNAISKEQPWQLFFDVQQGD